jgi:hypothetical protein
MCAVMLAQCAVAAIVHALECATSCVCVLLACDVSDPRHDAHGSLYRAGRVASCVSARRWRGGMCGECARTAKMEKSPLSCYSRTMSMLTIYNVRVLACALAVVSKVVALGLRCSVAIVDFGSRVSVGANVSPCG